ncbi:helix-turn-helix transcriptional regulator [Lentzea tibetensis]|uniref:helix-turn-helix transcriptional regulator n=1 Tax=Lentzea tibetensis TaxID=2591470 RepID=UPI001647E882|nr:helix-turn-helix transcriptional regulator [Lentzea tibetensis]
MRSSVDIAAGPGFVISSVTCRDDHARWSEPEAAGSYRVVLVRRGRFRRRSRSGVADVDPTTAYLGVPGEEEVFAHPAGGDVCTAVSVSRALWRSLGTVAAPALYVDARLDLAHRRLLAAARAEDHDFALAEQLVRLLGSALAAPVHPVPGEYALVGRARSVIHDGHPAAGGLVPLAAHLGVSPYRLSRVFPRVVGVSLTRYRNRVRVGRALDRIEQGEERLTDLAAELGFADQAHLSRTVREHVGETPSALRGALGRRPGR